MAFGSRQKLGLVTRAAIRPVVGGVDLQLLRLPLGRAEGLEAESVTVTP